MTTLEILLAIISPTVMVAFFIINMIQRLARLETKTNFVLKWIAALNGEMNDKKEFKDFLEELKEVVHEKGL